MSEYVELYKKYRPKDWNDIVGQDHVVESLRQAVIDNNIPSGYLFAGKQHGSGKTSSALVLAKALNCENLKEDGNPCNECSTCHNIDNNRQIGFQYISMANRGSVDDVRDIVSKSQMAQPIKRQVWILDECHRMSTAAMEAWLIPLESDTNKSVFIFCSTEPEKILDTVKSRLQLRTFSSIDTKVIANKLLEVTKAEKLKVTPEQIVEAAREANGGLRNAMANLEILANGGELTTSARSRILNLLVSKNPVQVLALTSELEKDGADFKGLSEQLFRDLSTLILLSAGANLEESEAFKTVSKSIGTAKLLHCADILGDTLNRMAYNTVDKRILFEISLTKITNVLRQGGK